MTPDQLAEQAKTFFVQTCGPMDGQRLFYAGMRIEDQRVRSKYFADVMSDIARAMQGQKLKALPASVEYKRTPVSVRQFICDPYYLDKAEEIYPIVLKYIEEMNDPQYQELVLTGGIGSAKTTCALYTIAYQTYLLSCMRNPHKAFGLDSASEILMVFQSISGKISKASFERFKAMIEQSKYFAECYPFNKDIMSKLVFPNRIEVIPISGQETGAIGQNVIGGLIDELNYMQVTEKSKQSVDGGTYDQAVALYNSIARRRKSRFLRGGRVPGKLCLVSSKRYPGQFTDIKEEEAKRDKTIYVYDKRVWEIKPEGSFTGDTFDMFVGDLTRKPRIMKIGETVADEDRKLVMAIPVEFREEFEKDPINALREIAGVSTLARHPYFLNVEAVTKAFARHQSIFSRDSCDFVTTQLAFRPGNFVKPELPRFAHVDLAISGDSAGLTIGTVTGFKKSEELSGNDLGSELMPIVHIDGLLEIKPPKGGEILFWKVRQILLKLREAGLNIRWVTFDSFQSTDSIQLLRQQGFVVGLQSVDVTTKPYDYLKSAVYSGRLHAPEHAKCRLEIVSLERDAKTGKIDHPPNGSKDVSDSLAGVVYGLTSRREIWSMYKVPIVVLPSSNVKTVNPENEHKAVKQ